MENLSLLHTSNIIVHITAGSIALLTGAVILIARKGNKFHKKAGKLFLLLLAIVIITGLIGVFVFGRNTFLLVITVLSGYLGFSGYRNIHNKTNNLYGLDIAVALLVVMVVSYFLYYFNHIGMIWAPVIIYSTVGYLLMVISYDLLRYFIPAKSYGNLWLYEHIVKMTSAFTALLSAFTGTVFPQYQPYSQFLPSVFGTLLWIGLTIRAYRETRFKDSLI